MVESVLQNCTGVNEYPFPHVDIKNALSEGYYKELYETLPKWQDVAKGAMGDNLRVNHFSEDMIKYGSAWKDFIKYHTSNDFYQEFIFWFGNYIREYLPDVERKFGKLEDIPIKQKREGKSFGPLGSHILLGVYTPTSRPTIARDAHIDKKDHLSSGLLYLADPNDDASGNLELFECSGKPKYGKFEKEKNCIKGKNIHFPSMKVATSIQYEPNRFATFLCTQKAVHRVGLRMATKLPRRFAGVSLIFNDNIRDDL